MFLGLPLWGLGAVLISSIDVRVALRRFAGQFLSCSEALDQGVSLGTHCVGQGREEPDWGTQLRPSSGPAHTPSEEGHGRVGDPPHSLLSHWKDACVGHVLWVILLSDWTITHTFHRASRFAGLAKSPAVGRPGTASLVLPCKGDRWDIGSHQHPSPSHNTGRVSSLAGILLLLDHGPHCQVSGCC